MDWFVDLFRLLFYRGIEEIVKIINHCSLYKMMSYLSLDTDIFKMALNMNNYY